MNVFPCPTSAAALCHEPSPELHPSSAAELKSYCRDTQSLLDLAYVSHPPRDVVSLQDGTGKFIRNACQYHQKPAY